VCLNTAPAKLLIINTVTEGWGACLQLLFQGVRMSAVAGSKWSGVGFLLMCARLSLTSFAVGFTRATQEGFVCHVLQHRLVFYVLQHRLVFFMCCNTVYFFLG
jgi:hypothetical protein